MEGISLTPRKVRKQATNKGQKNQGINDNLNRSKPTVTTRNKVWAGMGLVQKVL